MAVCPPLNFPLLPLSRFAAQIFAEDMFPRYQRIQAPLFQGAPSVEVLSELIADEAVSPDALIASALKSKKLKYADGASVTFR